MKMRRLEETRKGLDYRKNVISQTRNSYIERIERYRTFVEETLDDERRTELELELNRLESRTVNLQYKAVSKIGLSRVHPTSAHGTFSGEQWSSGFKPLNSQKYLQTVRCVLKEVCRHIPNDLINKIIDLCPEYSILLSDMRNDDPDSYNIYGQIRRLFAYMPIMQKDIASYIKHVPVRHVGQGRSYRCFAKRSTPKLRIIFWGCSPYYHETKPIYKNKYLGKFRIWNEDVKTFLKDGVVYMNNRDKTNRFINVMQAYNTHHDDSDSVGLRVASTQRNCQKLKKYKKITVVIN